MSISTRKKNSSKQNSKMISKSKSKFKSKSRKRLNKSRKNQSKKRNMKGGAQPPKGVGTGSPSVRLSSPSVRLSSPSVRLNSPSIKWEPQKKSLKARIARTLSDIFRPSLTSEMVMQKITKSKKKTPQINSQPQSQAITTINAAISKNYNVAAPT